MLSNAYFLAKIRFDTAENEPAKILQNFANFANFANFPNPNPTSASSWCAPVARRRKAARSSRLPPPASRPSSKSPGSELSGGGAGYLCEN